MKCPKGGICMSEKCHENGCTRSCGVTIAECAVPRSDDANPKDIAGRAKPQLHLIPSPALIEVAKVMGNGAFKYGPYNWREKPVCHTTYISAAERHERSHLDGELFDPDAATPHPAKGAPPNPKVYHLAAAAAGLLILLDAILTGNAIDDRPKVGVAGSLINPPSRDSLIRRLAGDFTLDQ